MCGGGGSPFSCEAELRCVCGGEGGPFSCEAERGGGGLTSFLKQN